MQGTQCVISGSLFCDWIRIPGDSFIQHEFLSRYQCWHNFTLMPWSISSWLHGFRKCDKHFHNWSHIIWMFTSCAWCVIHKKIRLNNQSYSLAHCSHISANHGLKNQSFKWFYGWAIACLVTRQQFKFESNNFQSIVLCFQNRISSVAISSCTWLLLFFFLKS